MYAKIQKRFVFFCALANIFLTFECLIATHRLDAPFTNDFIEKQSIAYNKRLKHTDKSFNLNLYIMNKITFSTVAFLSLGNLFYGQSSAMALQNSQTCETGNFETNGFTAGGTYTSSFNTAEDLKGWTQFRVIPQKVYAWAAGSGEVVHDYAPGYTLKNNQADDWYVSPAFNIEKGAQLDSIVFKNFGMMSDVQNGDTIGVYLLHGNSNPALATKKKLLIDIRGENYKPYEMMSCKSISLEGGDEPCYIALRYKNDVFTSRWYTIGFYHIALSGIKQTSGVDAVASDQTPFKIVSALNNQVNISGLTGVSRISLIDFSGRCIDACNCNASTCLFDISSFPSGVYIVNVESNGKRMVKKIIKQ